MEDKEKLLLTESKKAGGQVLIGRKSTSKIPWYLATGFILFWGLLFFGVVIPFYKRLPTALTLEDANENVFIAERAYKNLYTLSNIGYKLTGSKENEIEAVQFILNELAQIKEASLKDFFDMEIDLSQASGSYPYKTVLNVYQGVQNIAVKLIPKNYTTETYLLVNSHFDSKPFTPSAGDAGFMIVTMLEVLRVIATTKQTFQHPIVFLFNGAEEGMMQASHGFITQHKWAPLCKAVVNLDAGGSGGREILFQSGPNHSWLLKYYKKYIKYPFATTFAEEIFQSGIIPSDSDFTQFKKYGKVPGLDMVQLNNGYIYHTKYDMINIIPRESLQNTGDNVLSIVRGLANATELHDTKAHMDETSVFFDFLGLRFIYYSETTGIWLYVCPSLIGLSLPITIYYTLQGNKKIPTAYHLQLALHGQSIILALLVICLTIFGLRSTYILLIPLIFYVLSLAFNLLTTLHDRGYAWTGLLKASQIIPFLHSSYIIYVLIVFVTPISARSGSASNRDLYIAGLAAAGTVLSFGFLVPLINTFRRPSLVVLSLLAITALSMYLASSTQIGFPFRPKTSGQRVAYLQVRNMFYEYDGTLSKDESGYLFNFQDRREETTFLDAKVNLTGLVSIKSKCDKYMMCGMPLYDYRYVQNRLQSKWLPRSKSIEPPAATKLELISKTTLSATTVRFEFNLTGPSHMSLFIQAYEDVELSNWSFLRRYLDDPPAYPLSYHIYFTYGIDSSPLNFFLEFSKADGNFNVPMFQMGVSGHYIELEGDAESLEFASTFPSFGILATWPVLYQRYIF
ncbi:endoplasmic reticulum metallopeptidase 1-like [Drosophila hydei]|uniref:FXNA-like protease n=1 Tax=Drosophila hydei TaxID=7224 RepID=A0A6J2SU89_DROHY|nr:endoplasmic reticulum metallopeptidase 1-like [Drosophila hydei]